MERKNTHARKVYSQRELNFSDEHRFHILSSVSSHFVSFAFLNSLCHSLRHPLSLIIHTNTHAHTLTLAQVREFKNIMKWIHGIYLQCHWVAVYSLPADQFWWPAHANKQLRCSFAAVSISWEMLLLWRWLDCSSWTFSYFLHFLVIIENIMLNWHQYLTIRYDMIWCDIMLFHFICHCNIKYELIWYDTIFCNIQLHVISCNKDPFVKWVEHIQLSSASKWMKMVQSKSNKSSSS